MRTKRTIAIISLVIILLAGLYAVILPNVNGDLADDFSTYSGKTDVVALYEDPESFDNFGAEGVADVIVNQNLSEKDGVGTMAANNVAAVVFDYRGFDTLGESFILLTSIAGAYVILSMAKKSKKEEE